MALPTLATRPQASWPKAPGRIGYVNHGLPSHAGMFDAHTPQPSIRTRSSFGPAFGTSVLMISILPGAVTTAARISAAATNGNRPVTHNSGSRFDAPLWEELFGTSRFVIVSDPAIPGP